MGRRMDTAWAKGTVGMTAARERGDVDRQFQSRLMVTRATVDRLGLEKELHGHMGCVNCLEWSPDGSILASASDDLHVILWDPHRYRLLHNIATGHTGNIFSVKFLSPSVVATCAADGTVRARSVTGGATLLECACHCGRVKRLASAPDTPQLLWSAAEDGLVLQHDLRAPHRCDGDQPSVVVNLLNHMGRYAEAKCVAVNPRRPYQLAVGANDFYVRMYDTRMIKLARLQTQAGAGGGGAGGAGGAGSAGGAGGPRQSWERQNVRCARAGHGDPEDNIPRGAVQYFAPGHLSIEPNEHTFPKKATTYVAFSHDGNELLVNLGSEQVYLFDINSARRPVLVESFIIQHNHGRRDDKPHGANGVTAPPAAPAPAPAPDSPQDGPASADASPDAQAQLPEHVREMKEIANDLAKKGRYAAAVEVYDRCLAAYAAGGGCGAGGGGGGAAILLANRAAALLGRRWAGDAYAAVRDCYAAAKHDPAHVKAHFRLAKALMELRRAREAHECLLYFRSRFPRHARSHAVSLLQRDIDTALDGREAQPIEGEAEDAGALSALERHARANALDYAARFLGHCNTTTDIKEANFLGHNADFLAAGSDDGSMFVWCRRSGAIARCLRGDESIVNCLQMHPSMFLLATSGIEAVVRLWSPRPEDGSAEPRVVSDMGAAAVENQRRMRSDPFEAMLLNISFAAGPDRDVHSPACRTA